jgi:pimeloyl-ACP methyl ester carboxylesterase
VTGVQTCALPIFFDDASPRDGSARLHLVIGDRSPVFDAADRAHAERLARDGRASLDVLPAGHWVHVDDPDGLTRALLARTSGAPALADEVRS